MLELFAFGVIQNTHPAQTPQNVTSYAFFDTQTCSYAFLIVAVAQTPQNVTSYAFFNAARSVLKF
jgi:hypothetical protein